MKIGKMAKNMNRNKPGMEQGMKAMPTKLPDESHSSIGQRLQGGMAYDLSRKAKKLRVR